MLNAKRVKAAGLLAILAMGAGPAAAEAFQTIYSFANSPDGADPTGEVAITGGKLNGTPAWRLISSEAGFVSQA